MQTQFDDLRRKHDSVLKPGGSNYNVQNVPVISVYQNSQEFPSDSQITHTNKFSKSPDANSSKKTMFHQHNFSLPPASQMDMHLK